jgi:hypothetical protein
MLLSGLYSSRKPTLEKEDTSLHRLDLINITASAARSSEGRQSHGASSH